jgi:hypothetical protein
LTHSVTYEVLAPQVVRVDPTGLVSPLADGKTEIVVRHMSAETRVAVEVRGFAHPQPIAFEQQIIPILTKAGCNSGGCHGKAEGQNGFKLSVFGSNPTEGHPIVSLYLKEALANGAGPKKVIQPPEWLGWCMMSIGGVLILHSLAMRKPGGP